MSRRSQAYEDDLLLFLLGDDDSTRSTTSSSTAMLVDRHHATEEEAAAVDPLLRSPLTEDAALVAAMFEREAELCGGGGGASSSEPAASVAGASTASVQVPAEEMIGKGKAIKFECHSEDVEIKCSQGQRDEEYSEARRTRSAEIHNRCERLNSSNFIQRRRGRINQRFKALQELVPRCNDKSDKASILDETIIYMKTLQQQVQMISNGCGVTQMMFPAVQTCMLPAAAMCTRNIAQPVPVTSDQVMAGAGGCPVYPSIPYGLFGRVPAAAADSVCHQSASWPLFPPAFQAMGMANFGQAMGAATSQQYQVPNASNVASYEDMQVGSSPVDGYRFLPHSL